MKFIADVMLGRLAKRLRLLGFDVLYDRAFDDNTLIRFSLEQDRVLLTRDRALAERPLAENHVLIISNNVIQQLDQVLSCFPLNRSVHPLTRCSECNTVLRHVSKYDVKDLVPQFVYDSHDSFLQCETCGRVYWMGTHIKRMGLGNV